MVDMKNKKTIVMEEMGLPMVKAFEIKFSKEMFDKNIISLRTAINHSNDWIFGICEETYPPALRTFGSTLYIPKFNVIIESFFSSLIVVGKVECGFMFEIMRQLEMFPLGNLTKVEWREKLLTLTQTGQDAYRDSHNQLEDVSSIP